VDMRLAQRRQIEIAIDFVGFRVADLFVAGSGTDYAEKYRAICPTSASSSDGLSVPHAWCV
jgi:hypoxanthine-guanine phosphoribosyltransferase